MKRVAASSSIEQFCLAEILAKNAGRVVVPKEMNPAFYSGGYKSEYKGLREMFVFIIFRLNFLVLPISNC